MGVYINLDIKSRNINSKKWSEVYAESLILLKNYDFMNRVNESFGTQKVGIYRKGEELRDKNGNLYWKVAGI